MDKQPWDSSNAKAKELELPDFGLPEEIRKLAKPHRTAHNRYEAKVILKEILQRGPVVSKTGLSARLTSETIGKLISSDALNKSYDKILHYCALANLDRLFSLAIEPWEFELNPNKNNQGIKARHYLYAPFEYQGSIRIVKFTVKEYQAGITNKLYSLEALDIIVSG